MIDPRALALLSATTADQVRFVRLGPGGRWWALSKQTNTVRLGYAEADYALCNAGRWDDILAHFNRMAIGRTPGARTGHVTQIREFFTLPEETLWVTIADADLWWCFANSAVEDTRLGESKRHEHEGSKLRRVIGAWYNIDILGNRLRCDSMTTKITKISAFQGTISRPDGRQDILNKVRCMHSSSFSNVDSALKQLVQHVGDHLDQLQQDDFELLIELIFSSSGWRRLSPIGGEQKTYDLALVLPTTGEKSFVQVKCQTTPHQLKRYVNDLKSHTGYGRMFFVYHTPSDRYDIGAETNVTVWSRRDVAEQIISAGLVRWLLDRTT